MSIKHLHKVKIAFCYILSTYVIGNILSFNGKKKNNWESFQDIENLGLHATQTFTQLLSQFCTRSPCEAYKRIFCQWQLTEAHF